MSFVSSITQYHIARQGSHYHGHTSLTLSRDQARRLRDTERHSLGKALRKLATMVERHALVLYPETETYTTQALVKAFKKILPDWHVDTSRHSEILYDLQYADYDAIDWDAAENAKTLVNSYMLRKVQLLTK